jgi:hypothetical protein
VSSVCLALQAEQEAFNEQCFCAAADRAFSRRIIGTVTEAGSSAEHLISVEDPGHYGFSLRMLYMYSTFDSSVSCLVDDRQRVNTHKVPRPLIILQSQGVPQLRL